DAWTALQWFGITGGVLEREVLPCEVRPLFGRELANDLNALFEDVHALADWEKRDAISAIFVGMPACAEADFETPARQVIDRHERVGEHGRMAIIHPQDEDADAYIFRLAGDRRHTRRRFEAIPVSILVRSFVEVVPHVYPIEAGGVGPPPCAPHLFERDILLPDVESKVHRAFLRRPPPGRGRRGRVRGPRGGLQAEPKARGLPEGGLFGREISRPRSPCSDRTREVVGRFPQHP